MLEQFPRTPYEYSYLFRLANWYNAQNVHCYNTLNYLNRTLINRKPLSVYKVLMEILFINRTNFHNPNSQMVSEQRVAHTNYKLGKVPYIQIKNRPHSTKFFPFNLQHFFDKIPNYVLSHIGQPIFKDLLNDHLRFTCNHRSGKTDCKTCNHAIKQSKQLNHQANNLTSTQAISNIFITTQADQAFEILDDLFTFSLSVPYYNMTNPSDYYLNLTVPQNSNFNGP